MKKPLRIVVIGGTGYVGTELLKTLRAAGHNVLVFVRSKNAFLAERHGVEIFSSREVDRIGRTDAVVNLAHSPGIDLNDNLRKTRELFHLVVLLSARSSRVVHISTQAVFGYDLRIPIAARPVKLRHDHGYIESKILMENLLLSSKLASKLRIIRLGNVWGPASLIWTVQLARRLFFQQPVGAVGVEGYSNATEVANVASYILHVLQEAQDATVGIDHLAELGMVRWPRLIEPMARQLGVEPVLLPTPLGPEPSGWSHIFREIVHRFSPKSFGLILLGDREGASLLRRVLERLPESAMATMREKLSAKVIATAPASDGDDTLLRILTAETLFETSVLPGWSPPVDLNATTRRVAEWINTAGFLSAGTSTIAPIH